MMDITHSKDSTQALHVEIIRHTGVIPDSISVEEYTKTASREVEPIDEDVVALAVYKHNREGCIRVVGETVQNTITGWGNDHRRLLIFIDSTKGEKGWIYGRPDVRLYRRSNGVEKEPSAQKAVRVEVPERKSSVGKAVRVEISERKEVKEGRK